MPWIKKHMKLPLLFKASLILGILGLHAGIAVAQAYPSRSVQIVVPFAAGGSIDALARLIQPKLAEAFGQPVLVVNQAGAGGTIGTAAVAKAAPDGHTILLMPVNLAMMPSLYRKLTFDASKDFTPVTQLVATELLLVANPRLPANSVKELIALSKSKPGSLNFGSTGVASPLHLSMELLNATAGTDIVPIPYKGDGPLNTALMSGEVELGVMPVSAAQQYIQRGRLKPLGMTGPRRAASLPDVPTIAESGLPGFEVTSWQGLFVPANTPPNIVARIQAEAAKALDSADVRARLPGLGQEPVGSTPEEFNAKFRSDMIKFATIVKAARIPYQD
jgi:tripartite-type tricarboxylate transporter receptor subunit TctC